MTDSGAQGLLVLIIFGLMWVSCELDKCRHTVEKAACLSRNAPGVCK